MDSNCSEIPCGLYVTNNTHTKEKWDELMDYLKTNRFFFNEELDIFQHFISGLPTVEIIEGTNFYRARKGKYYNIRDLKPPDACKCNHGRLNPKGIQYLYLANSEFTAISEVRPWIGSEITVAKFVPVKKLKVLDFTYNSEDIYPNNYRKVIDNNFSRPMTLEDSHIGYLPTQAIAEYIRINGYDGVKYSSSISEGGYNVAIFDSSDMKGLEISGIVTVTNVKYSYVHINN